MKDTTPSPAETLARAYEAMILASVSTQYGIPTSDLTLLVQESAESTSEPGSYIFMVIGGTTMYGVYARKQADGTLARFVATVL